MKERKRKNQQVTENVKKQTNKQSAEYKQDRPHTNPRGELAGERLDEDFDFAVRSLSSVNSLATSTSW